MSQVIVIDNYDSFTWNLVHLIGPLVDNIEVIRNDVLTSEDIIAKKPRAIVLSPGPCTPNEAGICLDLLAKAKDHIPMFGVCLGLQAMGQHFGGSVIRSPVPMHGKVSDVEHKGQTIFRGINGPFKATRYHSLIVDRETCPSELVVTAETQDGLIMGLSHKELPVHGVQFHPESIMSEHGTTMMRNFFALADDWNKKQA
ncbi:aminodeoxychorismate/anthranilate synthase component II [Microvirga sp. W0021]|uniref:Aminodeoxychorismate/anthranilate synthase component II n=1 Tax=Hohaiivirga grylli TaxID=3133970 RepID=A0ABV0BKL4_9HYPH